MRLFRIFGPLATVLLLAATLWNGLFVPHAEAATTLVRVGASGTITGGGDIKIKVELSGRATADTTIGLKSNRPSVLAPPADLIVPKGSSSSSVVVTTRASNQQASVLITATQGSIRLSTTVVVKPPALSSVSLPPSISSGGQGNLTVRLNSVAPSGGMQVAIDPSTDQGFVNLPESVKVPGGSTGVAFRLTTESVSANLNVTVTGTLNGVQKSAITVILGGGAPTPTTTSTAVPPTATPTKTTVPPTATFTNTPPPPTATFTSTPVPPTATPEPPSSATLTCNSYSINDFFGNGTLNCQIVLNRAATVSISFNRVSSVVGVSTPSTLTIPSGATQGLFTITRTALCDTSPATQSLSFTGGGLTTPAVSISIQQSPMCPSPVTATLTCSKVSFVLPPPGQTAPPGYYTSNCQVTLNVSAASNLVLQRANTYLYLSMPSSITIPAGSSSVSFNIECTPVSANLYYTVVYSGSGVTTNGLGISISA